LHPVAAEIAPNFNDFSPKLASNRRLKRLNAFENLQGQWERSMWRDFAKAFRELRRSLGDGHGAYRPDLHYMRGPGPKWHAKYGGLVMKTTPAAKSAPHAALHTAVEHRA
jgi:hypothetical protein